VSSPPLSRIIYTGAFRFPDGDAAAARVIGIGRALRSVGYDVEFAGWESDERPEDFVDGRYEYDGFPYTSLGELRTQPLRAVARVLRYARMGEHTIDWLSRTDLSGVAAIVAYHGTSRFLSRLRKFCDHHGIALILDVTEWYDPSHRVGGRLGIVAADDAYRMRIVNREVGNIIAISSYLETYYSQRGCRTIRVPPLVNLREPRWTSPKPPAPDPETVRVAYAGSPGKKDLLGTIIRAAAAAVRGGAPIELLIIGPSRDEVLSCLGADASLERELGGRLDVRGRVPHDDVPDLLRSADFTVLLRPPARYAEAGMPTKLVESFAAGVPIIANLTGDLRRFLQHGTNAIIVEGADSDALCRGMLEASRLSSATRQNMRKEAFRSAEIHFEFSRYGEDLGRFFEAAIANA
jgi:glycosyltransferase involved in cell wall biosynthesis